jgi:hypothetical protein
MKSDLESLGIYHENQEDVSEYFSEDKNAGKYAMKPNIQKNKLSDTLTHFYPNEKFQSGVHSAIADAHTTLMAWKKKKEMLQVKQNSNLYFRSIQKSPAKVFVKNKDDICTCPKKILRHQIVNSCKLN